LIDIKCGQSMVAPSITSKDRVMRRMSLLISLPLLALPYMTILAVKPALAETLGPVAAASLLAKSQATNGQCKFLSGGQADELASYVARAEVAIGSKVGAASAKSALASGRAQGKATSCNAQSKQDVMDTLMAARSAIASLAPQSPAKPQVSSPPRLAAKTPKAAKVAQVIPASGTTGPIKLAAYEAIATKYYLARRCQNMSRGAISSFYKTVVANHRKSVSTFGVSAVAAVMRRAESKANNQSCS
jgi:hypothetical protein